MDRYDLKGGDKLKPALLKRVDQCNYFIVIFSASSSVAKWVTMERHRARASELKTGERKVFPVRLDRTTLPKILQGDLVLDFSNSNNFTADFFKLMHNIYQRPTHFEIMHTVTHDLDDGGYLFDLWVHCDSKIKELIEFVEYRFDYEFDYKVIIASTLRAVHLETSGRHNYGYGCDFYLARFSDRASQGNSHA